MTRSRRQSAISCRAPSDAWRFVLATVIAVNVGLPRDVESQGKIARIAIWKRPVTRVLAGRLNLVGDAQADLSGHGGEQRAIMVYQLGSCRCWEKNLRRLDFTWSMFGERSQKADRVSPPWPSLHHLQPAERHRSSRPRLRSAGPLDGAAPSAARGPARRGLLPLRTASLSRRCPGGASRVGSRGGQAAPRSVRARGPTHAGRRWHPRSAFACRDRRRGGPRHLHAQRVGHSLGRTVQPRICRGVRDAGAVVMSHRRLSQQREWCDRRSTALFPRAVGPAP